MQQREKITIGSNLRALRVKYGYTQTALSKKSGVSQKQISSLELDKSQPTYPTVQALARALGVHPTRFFND